MMHRLAFLGALAIGLFLGAGISLISGGTFAARQCAADVDLCLAEVAR